MVQVENPEHVLSKTQYGNNTFCSAAQKGNVIGCQFHPELSGPKGLSLLKKFALL